MFVLLNDLWQGLGQIQEQREMLEITSDLNAHLFNYGAMKSAKMAMTLLTVLPILFVYPFAQRYFVRGIIIGSIKGE